MHVLVIIAFGLAVVVAVVAAILVVSRERTDPVDFVPHDVFMHSACSAPAIAPPNVEPGQLPKCVYRVALNRVGNSVGGRVMSSLPNKVTSDSNPDWRIITYDDGAASSFLQSTFGDSHPVTKAYWRLNLAVARADLLRYLLVYVHGGLYMDLKSCARDSVPDMPEDVDLMVSTWQNQKHLFLTGEVQNWYVYGRSGSAVLWSVIETVVHNVNRLHAEPYHYEIIRGMVGDQPLAAGVVLATTGPIMLTRFLNAHPELLARVRVDPALNESLAYMCQSSTVPGPGHYSSATAELVTPADTATYVPRTVFGGGHIEHHKTVPFDEHGVRRIFGHAVADSFDAMSAPHKQEFWQHCMLYAHGGVVMRGEPTVGAQSSVVAPAVSALKTWHCSPDMIVTPPNNPAIQAALGAMLRGNFKFDAVLAARCEEPLCAGRNRHDVVWVCNLSVPLN
jgi:hypothetical protein